MRAKDARRSLAGGERRRIADSAAPCLARSQELHAVNCHAPICASTSWPELWLDVHVSGHKRFVYIIKSLSADCEYYVGVTSDFERRLEAHNAGLSTHTARYRPWRALIVIEFDEEKPALQFERYLKTGSGREFARRHFRQHVAARRAGGCPPRTSAS